LNAAPEWLGGALSVLAKRVTRVKRQRKKELALLISAF